MKVIIVEDVTLIKRSTEGVKVKTEAIGSAWRLVRFLYKQRKSQQRKSKQKEQILSILHRFRGKGSQFLSRVREGRVDVMGYSLVYFFA